MKIVRCFDKSSDIFQYLSKIEQLYFLHFIILFYHWCVCLTTKRLKTTKKYLKYSYVKNRRKNSSTLNIFFSKLTFLIIQLWTAISWQIFWLRRDESGLTQILLHLGIIGENGNKNKNCQFIKILNIIMEKGVLLANRFENGWN